MGRGSSKAGKSGAGKAGSTRGGATATAAQAQDYLNHHLYGNETHAKVTKITDNKDGTSTVDYDVDIRTSWTEYDSDGIPYTETDYETESRTTKLKNSDLKRR